MSVAQQEEQKELAGSFMDFLDGPKKPAIKLEEKPEETTDEEEEKEIPKVKHGFVPTDEEVAIEESKKPKEDEEDTKTPGGQIKALRKARDEAREELKKQNEEIVELRKKVNIDLDDLPDDAKVELEGKGIKDLYEEKKKLEEELESYRSTSEDLKGKLRDINIETDPDFESKYNAPIRNAIDDLDVLIAEVDEKGNIPNAKFFEGLKNKLFKFDENGPVTNAKQVKAVLKAFAEQYEQETGEEYDAPSPSEVIRSIRNISDLAKDRLDAKTEWEQKKESTNAENLKKQQAQETERKESLRRDRISQTSALLQELDYDKYKVLGDKSEVAESLKGAAKELEAMVEDPSSLPSWKEMIEVRFKAKQFDTLLKMLKKGIVEDDDSSQKGATVSLGKEEKEDVDWLQLEKAWNR